RSEQFGLEVQLGVESFGQFVIQGAYSQSKYLRIPQPLNGFNKGRLQKVPNIDQVRVALKARLNNATEVLWGAFKAGWHQFEDHPVAINKTQVAEGTWVEIAAGPYLIQAPPEEIEMSGAICTVGEHAIYISYDLQQDGGTRMAEAPPDVY